MKARILVVDDEPGMREVCAEIFEALEAEVVCEESAERALERLRADRFDLLVTDIKMPGMDGVDLMRRVRKEAPEVGVILITAHPKVETVVEALRQGALDYVVKPFHPEELLHSAKRALRERTLQRENVLLARQFEKPYREAAILGSSAAIGEAVRLIDRIASTPADVLLLGESGTGKELAARRLHARSGRAGRFVPLDCGAIPENLLENELFGHEKGAYTDARGSSQGLLEFADKGTLLMDEICEMPLGLQAKLLRTLQERQFRRVGGRQLISVDVRVLAATNRDIEDEVRHKRFREDLYYRINAIVVRLPPLRERRGDIALLAKAFLSRYALELGRPVSELGEDVLKVLESYPWPGNVRELENFIKRAVALCEGDSIGVDDLPESIVLHQAGRRDPRGFVGMRDKILEDFESGYFRTLLERHPGNVRDAALEARIPLSSFYRFLNKYSLR